MCNNSGECEYITGLTKTGKVWVPQFISSLNQGNCAGCGRCYKACPRRVFELIEHPASDDLGGHKVMSIARPEDCIGDSICQTVCTKGNIACRPAKREGADECTCA